MPRPSDGETPGARIAAIAHALISKHLNDFRDEMVLFASREILVARIEVMRAYGTFPEAMKLQQELDKVNWEIAKRNAAP